MTNRFTNSLPTRRENGKAGAIALSKATKFLASLGRWRFLIVPAIVFSLLLIDSSVSAQTVIQIGTGTGVPNVGTNPASTFECVSPYGVTNAKSGKRTQMIYTPAMINAAMTAASISPGPAFISNYAFNITSAVSSHTVTSYTVSMANIAQDQLTTAGGLYNGASTLVYSVGSYNMDNSTGWITSPTFGSPFLWDGSSNLLVEVCYSYSTPGPIGTYGGAQYTPDAGVGAPNHMATLLAYGPCANPSGTVTTFYTSRLTNIRLTVTSANVCAGNPAIGNVSSGLQCPNSSTDIDVSGLGGQGYTYQWLQSNAPSGTYVNAAGISTNETYSTPTTLPYTPTYYKVDVTCSNGGGITRSNSGSVDLDEFVNCYCMTSFSSASAATDIMTNVTLEGSGATPLSPTPLNNTSGIETNHYGLYGSIATPYGNVSQGSNYYLKVTKGTDVGSRANAWFDWNRDGVFGTTAYPAVGWEYLGATTAGNGAYAYPVFTVPASAVTGPTVMRVVEGRNLATNNACISTTTGETEDYVIFVTGGSCVEPSIQASGNSMGTINATDATINWSGNGNGNGGVFVLLKQGSSAPYEPSQAVSYAANANFGSGDFTLAGSYVVYKGSGSSVTVTGLSIGTEYTYSIYAYNSTTDCYKLVSPIGASFTTLNVPMVVLSSTTTQLVTANVTQNSPNNQIIGLQVVASGGTNPALDFTSITFNTSGSTSPGSDIVSAKIYYTGNSSTFTTTTQFGSTVVGPNGSHVVNDLITLLPGTNYFWVAYDIAPAATIGNFVDAQCTSFTAGSPLTPSVTNPAGSREIGLIVYCIPAPGGSACDIFSNTDVVTVSLSINGTGSTFNFTGGTCLGGAPNNYQINSYTGNLVIGNTYNITHVKDGGTFGCRRIVWIDLNNDGDFTDTYLGQSEKVMDVTSTNVSETGSNFVIPVGIVAGIHRMRVWSGYTGSFVPSDINTVTTGCESLNSGTNIGDVRDFNIDLTCPVPTISGLSSTAVCASASPQSIDLSYTGVTNAPTQYSITWNAAAITAGLVSVGFSALPASPISVSVPAALVANTYSGTLVVRNVCGSVSLGDPISITINSIPTQPASAGNVGICEDIPNGVLTATSVGNSIDWFNNPTGGSSINTGTTLTTGTAGTYYTQATTLATGCVNLTRTPITLTINPLPAAFNVTGGACTPAVMGLDGSEVGVNYQLIRTDTFNVVSNVGSIYAGTGSPLYMGYQNVAGTYQVIATSVVGGCTKMMTGVSTVGICISEWGGFTSDDWFTNTNWLPPAVPNICGATIVIYANRAPFPVIRTGPNTSDVQVGNMYIEGGATVTVNSGRTLSVCGDWNTFNAYTTDTVSEVKGAGKVIMNGGFTQGFTGISRFKLLELDNILGAAIGANAVASVETGLHLILGDFNTTAGTLHLLSKSATHSAYLDNFTPGFAGTLTGNIYMDRFMPIRGFNQHYMSSPVNAPTLKQLGASGPDGIFVQPDAYCDETKSAYHSPYGTVFSYDDTYMGAGQCKLGNWQIKSQGTMDNGRGYSSYQQGDTVRSLIGVPNTGDLAVSGLNNKGTVSVPTLQSIMNPIESGWNLVGNPYPSAIDLTTPRAGFSDQVQVWMTSGIYSGSWQQYRIGIDPHIYIAPFQAFMVLKTSAGNNGSFDFFQSERVRTNAGIQFFRTSIENSLVLEVDYNGVKDITTVEFNPEATDGFDAKFDASKPGGQAGRPTLFTHMNANRGYAINSLPSLHQATTVPMGLRPEANGTMKIAALGIQSFDPTSYIFLEDKQTGVWHNMRDGDYTFATKTTDNQDRFVLHFTPPAQILTSDATCSGSGMIQIEQPGSSNWNYSLSDVNGTVVSAGTLNASSPVNMSANTGVYSLTLRDNNGYTVMKNIQVSGEQSIVAAFTASNHLAKTQEDISFTSHNADAVTVEWNFGDGTTASTVDATHRYTSEGVYTVSLTVINEAGCKSVTTQTVTITSREATGLTTIQSNKLPIWSADNRVFIDFGGQTKVEAEIELYNIIGQLISSEKFGRSTIYSKEIPNLEAAYMIVKVKNDGVTTTKRVFIGNVK